MIQRYKYLILPVFLCLWTSILRAQEPKTTWELNMDESSATKNYVARVSIKLQNTGTTGFHFKAAGGKTFSAKIDAGLLFPPNKDTYLMSDGINTSANPADGAVVGSIPGQFEVSPTGGASYSIPINCPAGINNIQPNISLVYNSQGGNGTGGLGWNISGMSAIGKASKTIYSDGAVSGFKISKKEKYTIDGNTLLALENDYGSDGATYKTENKTYSIIKSIGQSENLNNPSSETYPLSFKVITKDGSTIEYGSKQYDKIIPIGWSNPAQPIQWLISKNTDANGNFIEFNYKEETGIIPTIQSITYSDLSVEFSYDEKLSISKVFIDQHYLQDKYLLRIIEIKSHGTTIRKYDLTYNYDTQKEKYFLKEITLTGIDNVKLNSTKINWGSDELIGPVYQTNVPFTTNSANQNYVATDINGDGKSELVQIYEGTLFGSTRMYANVYNCSLTQNNYVFSNDYLNYDLGQNFNVNKVKGYNGGLLFCDFNGDGKKAIVSPSYFQNTTSGEHFVYFNETSSGLGKYHYLNSYSGMSAYASGDINNDGIDEIISIEKAIDGNDNYEGRIFYVKKSDLTTDELSGDTQDPYMDHWVTSNVDIRHTIGASTKKIGTPKRIIVSDFNGDGLKDLFIITNNGYVIYINKGGSVGDHDIANVSFEYYFSEIVDSEYSTFEPGDFNGDGLTDFIINEHCNSTWKLAINNGLAGFTYIPLSNFSAIEEDYTTKNDDKDACIVTDFNHDGKSDIILIDAVYSNHGSGEYDHTDIKWYSSNGTSFNPPKSIYKNDETYSYNKYNTTGDFDGDGKEDVLTYGSDLCYGFSKSNNYFINSTYNFTEGNKNFDANQVTSLTDGMGQVTEITYQPLTFAKTSSGSDFYTKGTGSVYPVADMSVPINCVQKVKQPIDNINSSVTEYAYSGAKIQVTGKGFLGFETQTISNEINNTQIVSTTELEFPYCLPKTQTVVSSAMSEGGEISRKVITFSNTKGIDNVYVSLPSSTVETNSLNGLSKTTNYKNYDPSGNLTGMEIIQGDLTTSQTISYGQFGSWAWCLNKPIKNVTTKTLKGDIQGYKREKTYDYDATTGNLKQEISDPTDTKNKVTTTYSSFDSWGHPQIVSVATPGKTERTSYIKYTDSGRFINYEINHFGEKTTYDWGKEETGLLNSESDYQDHITSYTYNGLGQLTETKYANGIRKTSVMQWAKADNVFGAKYYGYSETSGSAPVWIWYDAYGRELVNQTYGLGGNTINVFAKYLDNGKVDRISEPTFVSTLDKVTADKWASIYNYDDPYGRVRSVSTPKGTTYTDYYPLDRAILVTTPDGSGLKITNNIGQMESNMVNGKTVTYTYYPSGLTHTSTPEGGKTLTMYYDLQGNRTKLEDPDAGTVETTYNGFGELTEEKQIVHNYKQQVKTTNKFLDNGLIDNIMRENIENFDTGTPTILHSETTSYVYDTEPKHTTRVKTIKIDDTKKQTFGYDKWDRVTDVDETVGAKVFNRKTEYDFFGRVKKEVYPSGYFTLNTFDNYSNLTEIKDSKRLIWKVVDENAKGQILHENKGGKLTSYEYYTNGLPKEIKADGVTDMYYEFETLLNLKSREDKLKSTSQKEVFGYDDLNRLTSWKVTRAGIVTPYSITYDDLEANTYGNIMQKSGIESNPDNLLTMSYGGNRPAPDGSAIGPHALTSISGVPASPFPSAELTVTYTDFKKIATLSEGTGIAKKDYNLTYGVDDQRRKSEFYVNNALRLTRYYLGNYEEEVGADNKVRKIHYLSGAILIQNNGVDSLLFTYSDYQGSLIALTDANDSIVRRYAYDPWGVRRNPDNWNVKDDGAQLIVNRGYTGHEHIDAFGIINMNGRVYDPQTAQFFSPDPYVQAPGNWVNYNRYGYAYGNPFKYTDPSGEFFYIMPNIGFDQNGGLTVGLTAGLGFTGFGVSASFNYGLQSHDWSVTAGIGAGVFSVYAGYGSASGFMAGLGMNMTGLPGGFSSNMTGLGVNWSENGGVSGNYFGGQISKNGVSFNPSISASYMLYGKGIISMSESTDNIGVTEKQNAILKTNNELLAYFKANNIDPEDYLSTGVDIEKDLPKVISDMGYRREFGIIWKKNGTEAIGGVTASYLDGFGRPKSYTFMSTHDSYHNFQISLNHEFIHSWQYATFGFTMKSREWESYKEYSAYTYSKMYNSTIKVPQYNGTISAYIWPQLPTVP